MNQDLPVIIDFYSCAGGASVGLHRAFDGKVDFSSGKPVVTDGLVRVVGSDLEPQIRYPFEFEQGSFTDVFDALIEKYNPIAVIGSPPCKVHTSIRHTIAKNAKKKHAVNMIPATREAFQRSGLPYVIENVIGAPLENPKMLCGSMFPDRYVRRHRLFETGNGFDFEAPKCQHKKQAETSPGFMVARYHDGFPDYHRSPVAAVYGGGAGGGAGEVEGWRRAMGIEWMVRDELSQAIPPDYMEFIGRRLRAHLGM